MKIKLLGDRILVKPNVKTVTQGGIIVPETAQSLPTTGTVLELGNDIPNQYSELKVGNFVKYYESSALPSTNWIKWNGQLILVLRSGDIIGIIDELQELEIEPSKPKIILNNNPRKN